MIQGRLTDIYRGRVCTRTHARTPRFGGKEINSTWFLPSRNVKWNGARPYTSHRFSAGEHFLLKVCNNAMQIQRRGDRSPKRGTEGEESDR